MRRARPRTHRRMAYDSCPAPLIRNSTRLCGIALRLRGVPPLLGGALIDPMYDVGADRLHLVAAQRRAEGHHAARPQRAIVHDALPELPVACGGGVAQV